MLWHFLLTQSQRLPKYTVRKQRRGGYWAALQPQAYLFFPNYKHNYCWILLWDFSIRPLVRTVMKKQPFNVLWSPASLPHSTTLSLVFIFRIIQTSHCLINPSFDHCCCWLHTSTKTPWKRSFSLAAGSSETSSCYLQHFGKQGHVQGNWRPNLTEHWVQLLAQLCDDSQLVHHLQNSTIQHSLP